METLTQKVHIFFCQYLHKDAKDVDSLTPAEQPTETMIEGHLMAMMVEMELELSQTPTSMNKHCFGYIKANGNRSY